MKHLRALLVAIIMVVCSFSSAGLQAEDTGALLRRYCVDCHGSVDELPEGDFSLPTKFAPESLPDAGPALKKALDAIEDFEMPPADGDQPSELQRKQLAEGIRQLLSAPSLGHERDPGRPLLRRLTRLEYNNSIRDLLGLETDVLMFSERLPFERSHYQPSKKKMPDRITMAAREYGAKYPVLLPDVSLPSDSRAEYGFSNRGDAQSLSASRLQQYLRTAEAIAFHPELLYRAERMEELFPTAKFRQIPTVTQRRANPITSSLSVLATNDNVARTAKGSDLSLEEFRARLKVAFEEDRGGVLSGEELRNTKIAGKGGLVRVAYGRTTGRSLAINPNEDWWFAPFATANESSGDTLLANYNKGQRSYELTFQAAGGGAFSGIAELGVVVLSRRGEAGTIRLAVTFDDDSQAELRVELQAGAGVDNTFVSFVAPTQRHIKRLAVDGSDFSGDYVLLDDLVFITHDKPNRKPLVQAEEPQSIETPVVEQPRAKLNRQLAQKSADARLEHFLRRAFRREVTSAELDVYLGLYRKEIESGASDETAMRATIQAVLASPSFLFLSEGVRVHADSEDVVVPLSDYELASRLSYFLWSSMPDDELLNVAAKGKLQDDKVLEQQVLRMLADRKSIELSENFFVQWLKLSELWSAQPDRTQFPAYYTAINGKRTLAQDMFGEILLLFQTIILEDRPVIELLDADYTYVNGKMLQYYEQDVSELKHFVDGSAIDIKDAKNDRVWNRVHQFDSRRGSLVTSPAMLTLTSFPHRTSSIRRGIWILDTVFNRHPAAPKVAVADIDDQEDVATLTLREKVERHRNDAACAVCHDRIDPPGFALENFDAIGRWRDSYSDEVIDSSGELAGIGEFKSSTEFRALLVTHHRKFVQGMAEHMLSFALGRKLEYYDVPVVERIVDRTIEDDCRISTMILEVAKSYPFRHKRSVHHQD